jgi:predicted amidohydrolase
MLFYFWYMSTVIRIGLTQFDLAWENPAANQAKVAAWLDSTDVPDLLVLPEMWSTGFTMNTDAGESPDGPSLQWMKHQAVSRNMTICGSLSVREGGKAYNRFYAVTPDGEVQSYDKRHLFSYGTENQFYQAGRDKLIFRVGRWRIRAIICYDLRFPAWCRNLEDVDILLCVANWPQARIHHWDALLRARAIENQCHVVAVNRIGTDGNQLKYPGHSSVYDMDGAQRLLLPENWEGIGNIALDREELIQYRDHYRFLQDRDRFSIE